MSGQVRRGEGIMVFFTVYSLQPGHTDPIFEGEKQVHISVCERAYKPYIVRQVLVVNTTGCDLDIGFYIHIC